MSIIETLWMYLSYPFARNAILVGLLVSLVAAILGVVLVLKRFSFLGDGLSHVAFGALAIASVLKLTNNLPLVLIITVAAAVIILLTGNRGRMRGDALIAVVSTGSLAIGYLLLNIFKAGSNLSGDVCSSLFGSPSILTLGTNDVVLTVVLSVLTLALFVIFYGKIFAVTFDEDFARASGVRTKLYNLLVAVVTAMVIVLAMNLVGSLLVSALIVFPALSAMRIFKNFKGVTICSGLFAVGTVLAGFIVSILASTPVGATIVACDIVGFVIFFVIGKIARR